MKEIYKPAPPEVLDEFARVSERFQAEFDRDEPSTSGPIADYFNDRGLYTHPTIRIPYTPDALTLAREIATDTKFPLPFVYSKFSPDNDFDVLLKPGQAYSMPVYKLNFIHDASEALGERYGHDYAEAKITDDRVHELAHSVFHANPTVLITEDEGLSIYEKFPLSGETSLIYSENESIQNLPILIEEAFAVFVSADYAKLPEQTWRAITTNVSAWGEKDFTLSAHYLIPSAKFPERASIRGGAIAGETLETFNDCVKGTIETIFHIARGSTDPEIFRAELSEKIGPELFGMMFSKQPYTTWSDTYMRVEQLFDEIHFSPTKI